MSIQNPYIQGLKESSVSENVYIFGEIATIAQIGGLLGSYAVSVIKIFDNFNPLAATAGYATVKTIARAVQIIGIKIGLGPYMMANRYVAPMIGAYASLVAGAFIYSLVSVLTFKEQLAINAVILASALFAKFLGKEKSNNWFCANYKDGLQQFFINAFSRGQLDTLFASVIGDCMAIPGAINFLAFYTVSAIKISNNFSPLAMAGSWSIASSIKEALLVICVKIGFSINAAHIISIPFGLVAGAGLYSFLAALKIKELLAINAVILIIGFATKYFADRWYIHSNDFQIKGNTIIPY